MCTVLPHATQPPVCCLSCNKFKYSNFRYVWFLQTSINVTTPNKSLQRKRKKVEKIWQIFHFLNSQLCSSSHRCMIFMNVPPFTKEIIRLFDCLQERNNPPKTRSWAFWTWFGFIWFLIRFCIFCRGFIYLFLFVEESVAVGGRRPVIDLMLSLAWTDEFTGRYLRPWLVLTPYLWTQ